MLDENNPKKYCHHCDIGQEMDAKLIYKKYKVSMSLDREYKRNLQKRDERNTDKTTYLLVQRVRKVQAKVGPITNFLSATLLES